MKIIVTSDLHGCLPNIVTPFDYLFICGDICPTHDHYFSYQLEWIKDKFCEWVKGLPYIDFNGEVILVPGNHDFVFERLHNEDFQHLSVKTGGRLVTLKNATTTLYNGMTVFGTPYCKQFGSWAFMPSTTKLPGKYANCPENVEFFLSHDAPLINGLGFISEGEYANTQAGNPWLADAIGEKKPKYFFCGHIHSGNHEVRDIDGTVFVNVSYVNENYYPVNPLLYLEVDDGTAELVEKKFIECETKAVY